MIIIIIIITVITIIIIIIIAIPDDGVPLTTLTTTLSTINLSCNDRIKLYYDHSVSWSNTTFDCMNSEEATSQGKWRH